MARKSNNLSGSKRWRCRHESLVLVDRAAEDLYPTWEKNRDQWNLTGGDHPYHYLGSAIWFTRIGHAMAEAMTELLPIQ